MTKSRNNRRKKYPKSPKEHAYELEMEKKLKQLIENEEKKST